MSAITSESAMILALRDHFRSPEYALLPQVRNGTGFERSARTADAIVMGVWPSRGLHLHGIEIKVSRTDWMREKDHPEKAEEISRFCDFWWLAAGSESIVRDGELPPTWGLLVPNDKGKLRIKNVPTESKNPTPITRLFLASLLRKTTEAAAVFTDIDAAIKAQVDKRAADIKADLEKKADYHTQQRLKAYEELQKRVAAFEDASGVKLDRYSEHFNVEIGQAVKALRMAGDDLLVKQRLDDSERVLVRALEDLRSHRGALNIIWSDSATEATP